VATQLVKIALGGSDEEFLRATCAFEFLRTRYEVCGDTPDVLHAMWMEN